MTPFIAPPPPGTDRKALRSAISGPGLSRREVLRGLAGSCGVLTLCGSLGCNRPSFQRRVGISIPYEAEILNEFYSDMKKEADLLDEELRLVLVDAEGDFFKQTIDIELFIAQGFGGVFMFVLPDGMDQIVARARAKGVCIFNHSATPITGCTQNIVLDQHIAGRRVGNYAGQWINDKLGGRAEVGILANLTDSQLIVRTEGLKDGLRETCPGAVLVGEVEANTVDSGATAAANLLQAHPNIAVILAFSDDPGVGAYTAALETGRKDRNRFFVGSADGTRLGMEKVAEGGIYQCCAFFFFSFSATQAIRDVDRCLRGAKVSPTRIMGSKLVTKENVAEFDRISHNPRAPEWAHFYTDPEVMRYSDVPLTTPE